MRRFPLVVAWVPCALWSVEYSAFRRNLSRFCPSLWSRASFKGLLDTRVVTLSHLPVLANGIYDSRSRMDLVHCLLISECLYIFLSAEATWGQEASLRIRSKADLRTARNMDVHRGGSLLGIWRMHFNKWGRYFQRICKHCRTQPFH